MSRFGTIARRTFLVGSAAVVGGVAFGAWQVAKTPANPLHPGDGTALNPWLIIDRNGITVIVPRAEMGQGVQTTLAALVAEELDADLSAIRVEHGPPAQAYFNGALIAPRDYEHALEPAPTGLGATLAAAMPKVLSLQVTGGSTTTIDAFEKMRVAGAAARETLLQAAAQRLNTGLDRLKTDRGAVIAPDGSRIPYADLAEAAAAIEPPKQPRLKDRADWRYLGKSQPRLDQPAKVTGTARFGIDTRLPGLLFASVRMSPRFGMGIASFDAAGAEALPGVEKVVKWDDGYGVIASNTWLALQALDAVEVDWAAAPYPPDTDGIFAAIETAFADKPQVNLRNQGDVDAALAEGAVIEAEYRAPYLAHATMEPMNATALYTGDALEVWVGNQAPGLMQSFCADAAGLKSGAVTIHTPFLGGGFGRRSYPDAAVLATRLATEMPGRPVQCTWSREEDMRHDYYRPGAIARFRAKLDGGRIAALDGQMAAASTMLPLVKLMTGREISPPDQMITEGSHDQPYAIPAFRVQGHTATPAIPVGFWRSVGGSQNSFFHESFIDELADAAGVDPLAFRLAHIRPEHPPSAKVLEKVAEMSGWTGRTPDGVGRGVAQAWSFGTSVASVIEVRDEDGQIRLTDMWIAADPGLVLDPGNAEAQLTGGAIYGLSAAMFGEITFADGAVEQENFPDYDAVRMLNGPRFHVAFLENNLRMGGMGEPGTPTAAPALANALFDLTGQRARELPLSKMFDFVG